MDITGIIPASYFNPGGGGIGKWILDSEATYPNLKSEMEAGIYKINDEKSFSSLVKL